MYIDHNVEHKLGYKLTTYRYAMITHQEPTAAKCVIIIYIYRRIMNQTKKALHSLGDRQYACLNVETLVLTSKNSDPL